MPVAGSQSSVSKTEVSSSKGMGIACVRRYERHHLTALCTALEHAA